MANEREARLILRFEADKNSLQRSQRDLAALEKAFEAVPAQIKRANADIAQMTRALIDQQRANLQAAQGMDANSAAARRLMSDVDRTDSNLRGLVEGMQESAQTAGLLTQKVDEAAASVARLNQATAASAGESLLGGGRQQAFRSFQQESRLQTFAVRSVTGVLPGGGGEFAQLATGAFELLDTIPKLNLSFDVLKRSIIDNVQAIGAGGVGLIGGLIALQAALAFFNAENEKSAQIIQNLLGGQEQYFRLLQTGTRQQIQDALEAKRQELEITRARIEENEFVLGGMHKQVGGIISAIADVANIAGARELREQLDSLKQSTGGIEFDIARLESALNSSQLASREAAAAEAALAETRAKAIDTIAALSQQRSELITDSEERALDAFFDRAIRERRASEDLARALERQQEAHKARLEAIEIAGQERIENIRENGLKRLAQFDEATSKLQGRLTEQINSDNERIRKLNADFMRGQADATAKARADELKRTQAHAKNMARLLEDRLNAELDAQEANDVVAFIQAQRRSEQQIKRAQEDFDDETRERSERFLAERREAEARYQERLTEIRTEAQARQQAIQDELAARQAARREIETEILAAAEAEKARIKAQTEAQQQAFDDQLARDEETRRIQRERQAEDDRLRQAREQDALNKQLRAIDTRIQMEADAAKLIVEFGQYGARVIGESHVNMAAQVASAVTEYARQAREAISSGTALPPNQTGNINWNLPRASFSGGGGGGGSLIAFAGGGVVDRPTFGLFGERPGYAEAFIPFRKSEGIEAALSRIGAGRTVNFNAPITVGDGVTQAQVKAAMTDAIMGLLDGLAAARGIA